MSLNPAAVVFFVLLWITTKAQETEVSCVFNESCVLPCSFTKGTDAVIHWLKTPGDVPVHSYYHSQDQFKDQDFKDRTSLFVDQISEGNASLLLTGVRVQDEGRYMCFIRTDKVEQSYINVRVKASVSSVNMEQVGDEVICRSEEIYPEPGVTWSGSDGTEEKTSVFKTEKGLYSISSSVRLSHKRPLEHSCNISTDHSWRSATYRLHTPINSSGSATILPCAGFNTQIKSLIWKFNHTQTILNQTGINTVYNKTWRQFVKEVSESGGLTLKGLSSDHQGVYSCVLSSDRETYFSHIQLQRVKTERTEAGINNTVWIIVGFIVAAAISAVVAVIVKKVDLCSQQSHEAPNTDPSAGSNNRAQAAEEIPLTDQTQRNQEPTEQSQRNTDDPLLQENSAEVEENEVN